MITNKKRLFKLALPLFIGIIISSLCGIFVNDFYSAETPGWKVQAIAQDYLNLFVLLPVLLTSFLLMVKGKRVAIFIWLGGLFYAAYTFFIYCFAVHFNPLFLVYCANLGLAVYSIIMFVIALDSGAVGRWRATGWVGNVAATFLILASIAFCGLWLSEIIPAIVKGVVPASIREGGAPTNPVHVLDLALFLPAICFAGVLYIKRNPWGTLLGPSVLAFMILMNITIAGIVIFQVRASMAEGYALAWTFIGLAAVSTALFALWMKKGIHR